MTTDLVGSPLIGRWSNDRLFAPGAQSDEVVVFKPDGSGWFEGWNWALCEVEVFSWRLEAPGTLYLAPRTYRGPEGGEQVSSEEPLMVSFVLTAENAPLYSSLEVVSFSKPIYGGPERFGRETSDVEGLETPWPDVIR